jgi:hypothetical protein
MAVRLRLRRELDEDVDVTIDTGLAAGNRTEYGQSLHTKCADLRFGFSQP